MPRGTRHDKHEVKERLSLGLVPVASSPSSGKMLPRSHAETLLGEPSLTTCQQYWSTDPPVLVGADTPTFQRREQSCNGWIRSVTQCIPVQEGTRAGKIDPRNVRSSIVEV